GHVGIPLSHRIGHAEANEPVLVGLERDLLEAHVLAEHLRHDLGHVVEGQILGTEQRNLAGTAPACVEQQARGRGGDVAGGDGRSAGVSQKTASAPANALSTTAASPCEPSTMSRSLRTSAGSCDGSRAMTRRCSPLSSRLPSTWRPIWPVGVVMTITGNLQM